MLEDLGHRVVEAHCGKEALAILDDGLHPDLVITDHAMPGMTGIDLAAHLRLRDPDLPILLATGFAEIRGDFDIEVPRLAKPYTQEQLSSEIARLLPSHVQGSVGGVAPIVSKTILTALRWRSDISSYRRSARNETASAELAKTVPRLLVGDSARWSRLQGLGGFQMFL